MQIELKVILALYVFNWLLSFALYGRWVSYRGTPLGFWMLTYTVIVMWYLVLLGDFSWKHVTLLIFAAWTFLMGVIAFLTSEPIKLTPRYYVISTVVAVPWLWLLLS